MKWIVVAGDLVATGGMDRANLALAERLVHRGMHLEIVAHRVSEDLLARPKVRFHQVARPLNSHFLGSFCLRRKAAEVAGQFPEATLVANGGNGVSRNVNWVHYLHAAWSPSRQPFSIRTPKRIFERRLELRRERDAIRSASLVICNSRLTADQVVNQVGVSRDRLRVVYYGSDAQALAPATLCERAEVKAGLGLLERGPVIAFIGALGDRRKNFDTVYAAWQMLTSTSSWDGVLLVIGQGADLDFWKDRASVDGLSKSIRFLGFRRDVPRVLSACDLLIHPARYEAYGLSPHEAICRGVPVLVSRNAGVSEVIPRSLSQALLEKPENPRELAIGIQRALEHRLRDAPAWLELSARLRSRSWDDMADEIIDSWQSESASTAEKSPNGTATVAPE